MPEPLTFDPELEGLLQEIAADPDSRLLRLPRAPTLPDLLAIPDPVSPARAGLSAAERHLLEVHRDEVADVLRRACLMKLFSDPTRSMYLTRNKTARESISVESFNEWRLRAREVVETTRSSTTSFHGLDLIDECVSLGFGGRVSVTQLAMASQVLQPTAVAEDYIGLDHILNREYQAGEKILQRLISSAPTVVLQSCALETLGLSAGLQVNEESAMGYYRAAVTVLPERINPLMSWLYFAVRIADRAEVLKASARLDELDAVAKEAAELFVSAHKEQDRAGAEQSTPSARKLAAHLQGVVGETSRRVLDAI